jgi:uncharacterized protein (TIGR03382 family)
MSWLTRGLPITLAVLAAAWLIVSRRRGEVWHSLDQGTGTGP